MRSQFLAVRALCLVLCGLLWPVLSAAQSLTSGSLRGVVLSTDGLPITGVAITVEGRDGRPVAFLESNTAGEFAVALLPPGTYRVLAEQVGLQPVRLTGVTVVAGQTTAIAFRLERRPPPITSVIEIPQGGALAGSGMGRTMTGAALADGRFGALTDISRQLSDGVAALDARDGWLLSSGGLNASASRMVIDGVPEPLLRHPGFAFEPAASTIFHRGALSQAQTIGIAQDLEYRGYPGLLLTGQTARGANAVRFMPYAMGSTAALGADAKDNPADSTGTSFQVGAVVSGPIVPDTAHFLLRFDYQQLQTPGAYPWEQDGSVYNNDAVSLRTTIPLIAQDSFGIAGNALAQPTVRTWRGFSGLGRLDWKLGERNFVDIRVGFASWEEENPLLGEERSNLSGARLEASDLSGAIGVTSLWTQVANEFRLGLATTKRDWLGAPVAATALAAEGVAFGNSAGLPARFDQTIIDVSDAVQFNLGRHRLKAGANFTVLDYEQNYRYGAAGLFTFGGLDQFGRAEGTFYQAVGAAGETANPRLNEAGVFFQDTWSLSPEISLILGVRYDKQAVPTDKIARNEEWFTATGIANDNVPEDTKGIAPRVGFVWNVQNRGEWVIRGGAGMYSGRLDPATFSEVMLFDGGTTIRRGIGTFTSWPATPDAQLAPTIGPRLTLFNSTYRNPRTFKAGLGLSRTLAGGVELHFQGAYHHTDYLLRRTDLNRVAAPVGETQEGRPVFGTLVQQGGLLSAAAGSNRRFGDFDLVMGLSPTGFSDYYEFTTLIQRQVPTGLSLSASYTFSKTEDNVPGQRFLDPADGLNPFPDGFGGTDWAEGRSDFDVPHRLAASAEYRIAGRSPIALGARFRFRSGLPFTPGFRPGVDANGDGAGNNDPAFLDAGIPGLSSALAAASCTSGTNAFAERNSCREDAAWGLDLRVSIGLPVTLSDGGKLLFTVDAFNIAASALGLVDRALVLVDPNGTTSVDGQGTVTLPLIANSNFGQLLARRNDPRLIRFGLRMEY